MTDSFAGISVPSGSVGELRASASRLAHQAGVLADASQRLSGMPSAASSWIGPAHSAYAGRCIRASTAAGLAAQSFTMAAGAGEAYADELHKAKAKARAAIDDARRAQHEIDHAKREISLGDVRRLPGPLPGGVQLHRPAVADPGPRPRATVPAGHHAPVLDPSPDQFPGARPVTRADLHRGLGAGAAVAAATPGGGP